jgi:hypothetical protein
MPSLEPRYTILRAFKLFIRLGYSTSKEILGISYAKLLQMSGTWVITIFKYLEVFIANSSRFKMQERVEVVYKLSACISSCQV